LYKEFAMPYVFESMPETAKKKNRVATQLIVKGRSIRCPLCNHDQFWEKKVLLNSRGMTFFGLDWANKESQAMVCDDCGHVLFFAR
jgi:DNA-directed RNA polymerase subunit RPC12/RpoP